MTDNQQQPIAGLPPLLAEFARATSVGLALRLAADYGGQRKYIPEGSTRLADDHWLVQCVGRDAAKVMSEMRGREWVEIPNAAFYKSKKSLIARAQGSTNKVAKEFGVTSRWVRMVRAPYGDDNQADLFSTPEDDQQDGH